MKSIFTLLILLSVLSSKASGFNDSLPRPKPSGANALERNNASTKPVVINMRCAATNFPVDPVLVIDGLPHEMDELKRLNPNGIESIDILKDAAATALYGYRAARGVIIITTKEALQRKFIIKDFLTGTVIPNATICLTNGSDSIKAIANDDGAIITDKLRGGIKYHLAVSSAGYKTFSTLTEGRQQEIRLERDVKECPPVIISSTECPRGIHCGLRVVVTREKAIPNKSAGTVKPVFPNPVLRSNVFNLDFDSELGGTIQLAVVNISGGVVLFQSQKANKGLNHFSLTADTKWSAGIYNIQLRNEKGTLVRQEKLVVQ